MKYNKEYTGKTKTIFDKAVLMKRKEVWPLLFTLGFAFVGVASYITFMLRNKTDYVIRPKDPMGYLIGDPERCQKIVCFEKLEKIDKLEDLRKEIWPHYYRRR